VKYSGKTLAPGTKHMTDFFSKAAGAAEGDGADEAAEEEAAEEEAGVEEPVAPETAEPMEA
jgi:hypothetical protein